MVTEADTTITQNLTVAKLDSMISGIVVNELGNPVPNSLVWLRIDGYETNVRADEDGAFLLHVPANGVAEIDAADLNVSRRTIEYGQSVSTFFAVMLLADSGLSTIPEPHFHLQSEASTNGVNILAGLGNNVDVQPVSLVPEEVDHHIYLPVIAQYK